MKKLILTFFMIVLILLLIKNKMETFSPRGCHVHNIAKPTETDFYNCFLRNISAYNSQLRRNSLGARVNIVRQLGLSIRDYFKALYKHGLEREYRVIIVFVPASYRQGKPVEVIKQDIKMKNFMTSPQQYDKGIYRLKPNRSPQEKYNFIKTINFRGKNITQVNGVLVGMGFKFAISGRSNNKRGNRCSRYEPRPWRHWGACIPGDFKRFDSYLPGGRYINYAEIIKTSRNWRKAGGQKIHQYEPSKWVFRNRNSGHSSKGCGSRTEQNDWQTQRGLDNCMSSCYLRSKRGCHQAYGDSRIQEVYVIPDFNFFNTFYVNSKKAEFAVSNYSSLNRYH